MSDVTQDGKIAAQKGNDVSVLDELRDALRAENERLATELEEARGMLRLALKELGPLGLIGADGRRHYSTENWRQLLRARYREGAK